MSENLLTYSSAKLKDVTEITKIYNWAVINTTSTFDTELKSTSEIKDKINNVKKNERIITVFGQEPSKVIAWGSILQWSPKKAYSGTCELSLYVDPEYHGKKIGTLLLEEIINQAKEMNYHTILARVVADSHSSLHIHKKLGFELVGVMKEVGFKFNKWRDVHLLQKMLD